MATCSELPAPMPPRQASPPELIFAIACWPVKQAHKESKNRSTGAVPRRKARSCAGQSDRRSSSVGGAVHAAQTSDQMGSG